MLLGGLLSALATIDAVPGRSWRWAPDWQCSDASVLFDRNSGDYWLLTPAARTLLRQLEVQSALSVEQLHQLPLPDLPAPGPALEALLAGLMRSGLIRAWDNARHPLAAPALPDID